MSESSTCKSLNDHLANLYGLYVKTHNYHWNVHGMHFNSLHAMFQDQYTDLASAIDDIAERIRQLGQKVPASLELFAKNSSIEQGDENASHDFMVKDLASDHEKICAQLNAIIRTCDEDEGTKDLITERLRVHSKTVWMLKACSE